MNAKRQPPASSKPSSKQSWRKAAGSKPTSGKLWSATPSQPEVWLTRSFKLFAALVLLLATTAGVIAYLTRTDDRASMLVLAIDDYRYPWAPNAWAKEDADWLDTRLDKQAKKINVILAEDQPPQKTLDEWISFQLGSEDFSAGGPGGSIIWRSYGTAIIYLSAHLAVDQAGLPCVMSPTATSTDAWQGTSLIPLQKVLDSISGHEKLQPSKFRGIRKLVVLDIGKQPPNMTLGRCNDALHESIQGVVEKQTDRNLAVIVSCADGQRSWTAPELGGSNFGIWFAQGLSGAADKDRNGRVRLRELLDYLKIKVNQFANAHRAAFQEPVCFFPGGIEIKFDLAFAEKVDPKTTPRASMANLIHSKIGQDVAEQWAEFESWKEKELGYDPWRVTEVHGRLIRTDQLLLAGPSHQEQLQQEISKITELLVPLPKWPISVVGQSKAMRIDEDWSNLGTDVKKSIMNWLEQVPIEGKPPEKPPAILAEQAHVAAWTWLLAKKDSSTAESIESVRRMQIEAKEDSSQALPARDRVLLQSLIERFRSLKENSNLGDAQLIAERLKALVRILDAHRKLENVFDIQDPRLGSWLVKQKSLLQTYLKANDFWFVGSAEALRECDLLLDQLFGNLVDGRTDKLKQATEERRRLEAGWKLHDELVMHLPRMVWTVDNQSSLFIEKGKQVRESYPKLSEGLKALHAQLSSDQLPQVDDLRSRWDAVNRLFYGSFMALDRELELDASTCRDILLWLEQSVVLRAETRSVLRERLVNHLKQPIELNTDEAELSPVAFEFPNLESWEKNPAVSLLSEVWPTDWTFDEKSPLLDSRYLQLHQKVWDGSLAQLEDKNRVSDVDESIKQAWYAQIAAPWLAQYPTTSVLTQSKCPTRSCWANFAQLSLLHMADFAREDFWVLPTNANRDASNQYFAMLAQNWINAARSPTLAEGNLNAENSKVWEALLQKTSIASRDWKDDFWNDVPTQPLAGTSTTISIMQPKKNQPEGVAALEHSLASTPLSVGADKPTSFKIDLSRLTSSAAILRAGFRGRSTERDLPIQRPTADLMLAWNVTKTDVTQILVSADDTDHQVLFVLDCSSSFSDRSLENAKEQILLILEKLPASSEVGLAVFGHSAFWGDFRGNQIEFNAPFFSNQRLEPLNIRPRRTPENDVDLLVPLDKKSDQTEARFRDKLLSLKPYGFTPLYYAMQFSLDHLAKMNNGLKQNLVVITDGNNNVTIDGDGNEIRAPLRQEYVYSKDKIKEAIAKFQKNGANLQLDVIAYEFEKRTASSAELEKLAGENHFHRASNENNELSDVVRKILGLRSFNVKVDKQESRQSQFGRSVSVETNKAIVETGKPPTIQLSIQDSTQRVDFVAMGGEFLEGKFDAERNQLTFIPLGENFHDFCDIDIGGRPVKIGTLNGTRKGNTQFVRAAIQSVDPQQPSVRPRRLWVEMEVQPIDRPKDKLKLGISDVQWEAEDDRRAPVFRIPILHGVPEKIQVWLSFEDSKLAMKLPYTKWESKGLSVQFPNVEAPLGENEGKGWTLSFTHPITSRLAWTLDPSPNSSIEYLIGKEQRQKYWYRSKPEEEVEIRLEKMPAADRPNTSGWSTSEWLNIPRE